MELKEAIEILQNAPLVCYETPGEKMQEAIDMAISALGKQVGKKPDYQFETMQKHRHMLPGVKAPFCPICGTDLLDDANDCFPYCPECGQKIDWTERK